MRRVIIESPYAGDVERNLRYLRACMADCLKRGEAPFASHGLYTQPGACLHAQLAFRWDGVVQHAEATVVYQDLGITEGMDVGIGRAMRWGRTVEFRMLGGEW